MNSKPVRFFQLRDREAAIARMRGACAPQSNSSALPSNPGGKSLRGVHVWFSFRMWSEKPGGGRHERCRRHQDACYSRTSGSGPRSFNVLAHGRCEVRRVASRGQSFLMSHPAYPKESPDFQRRASGAQGWKELPNSTISDESPSSAMFARNGFVFLLPSVIPFEATGVAVRLQNLAT